MTILIIGILFIVCLISAFNVARQAKKEIDSVQRKKKFRKAWLIGLMPIITIIVLAILGYLFIVISCYGHSDCLSF